MIKQESSKQRNWKKILVVAAATIMPGGFIALGVYCGIKKYLDRKKSNEGTK